ncbi:MAG: hypothetical protein NTV34_13500, partial [Proteobacteria bacterium]|nr:hypothetical protein [Pseudomonadota bacterium]
MRTSTTLQLKIYGMKKRLFEGFIPSESLPIIAFLGLICVVAMLIRILTAGGAFGVVSLNIPVVSAPLRDASMAGFSEHPGRAIDKTTLTVALTPKEFLFGDLTSFTNSKDDISMRFTVPHVDGSPQVTTLIREIIAWQEERMRRIDQRSDRMLILIPDGRVPMNVLIKVVKLLEDSPVIDQVLLAGGFQ